MFEEEGEEECYRAYQNTGLRRGEARYLYSSKSLKIRQLLTLKSLLL